MWKVPHASVGGSGEEGGKELIILVGNGWRRRGLIISGVCIQVVKELGGPQAGHRVYKCDVQVHHHHHCAQPMPLVHAYIGDRVQV